MSDYITFLARVKNALSVVNALDGLDLSDRVTLELRKQSAENLADCKLNLELLKEENPAYYKQSLEDLDESLRILKEGSSGKGRKN